MKWQTIVECRLHFDSKEHPGSGYVFDCDEDGRVIFNPEYEETQRQSYLTATTSGKYEEPRFERHERRIALPEVCGGCGKESAHFNRYCGAMVCTNCDHHNGLARCYCGWSLSGGDGRQELIELGENVDDDY